MPDFSFRLFNFPVERLSNPRRRLSGRRIPSTLRKLTSFKEHPCKTIDDNTDCIQLLNFFDEFSFDNVKDLKEYIQADELLTIFFSKSDAVATQIFLVTVNKYLFTCKRLLQYLVADDTVYSFHLPFLAESVYDLECSYYLMKGYYFKQSLQILRNVLEVTILHAYFGLRYLDNNELEKAIMGKYPSLKEMIISLRAEKLLTANIEQKYFQLYKLLSSAVHSEISKLTVSNSFEHSTTFSEWYTSFIKVATLNLETTLRMVEIGI